LADCMRPLTARHVEKLAASVPLPVWSVNQALSHY
jgi:hypothetical protein